MAVSPHKGLDNGFFLQTKIFADIYNKMTITREELLRVGAEHRQL